MSAVPYLYKPVITDVATVAFAALTRRTGKLSNVTILLFVSVFIK